MITRKDEIYFATRNLLEEKRKGQEWRRRSCHWWNSEPAAHFRVIRQGFIYIGGPRIIPRGCFVGGELFPKGNFTYAPIVTYNTTEMTYFKMFIFAFVLGVSLLTVTYIFFSKMEVHIYHFWIPQNTSLPNHRNVKTCFYKFSGLSLTVL